MKYCSECGNKLSPKLIDGYTRYVCVNQACNYVFWNNPIPVVAALVKRNGKYIIARNADWPIGMFSVITGYLEAKESPEDATLREVSEELGLDGTIKRHIGNYSFYKKNQIILCYEVEATGRVALNDELDDFKELSSKEFIEYDFSTLSITEKIKRDWLILYQREP
jgi:NADH pyrophosphatase NudC (nudix superfamily)